MSKSTGNPCSRCGKERKVTRTWKEKFGYSTVTNVETACPDKDCQKLVEADNQKQKDRTAAMKQRTRQRVIDRRAGRKVLV